MQFAVFFDLIENSMMDILIVRGPQSQITAVYNNYGRTAFFLKTRFVSDENIGTSLSTVSFKCTLTDLDDSKFIVSSFMMG